MARLLPSLLLALFFSCILSSCSARTVQVGEICSKHSNPPNCVTILYSIAPGASIGVDLDSLSRYTINFAHANAFDTVTLINGLIKNTTISWLRARYVTCVADYDDALLCLTQASDSFKTGDFAAVKSKGTAVMEDVQHCDWTSQSDSAALTSRNKYLEDVSMIITILADFLAGKY